ncbi:alpha/beta hydrolase [Formicincola oecophyllae]|uniref:Alpha/beta hydrolase n=2 Tax=Formicincola oecophyllae TaxID=2558361 RepID=A0A4Y6UE75_9PROT|nr:alpha/beta hydrolase [Formicincola oecophyllae]
MTAANLYLPPNFEEMGSYPALVIGGPMGACKEQSGGLYAAKLAAGYVTLTWDPLFQGLSQGEPRHQEIPFFRVADFTYAIDYLEMLPYVAADRLGALGICASGGYVANAALTERRIKAVGTVSGANLGRVLREGNLTPSWALTMLDKIAVDNTAIAQNGGQPRAQDIVPIVPPSVEAAKEQGMGDIDWVQASAYYRQPPHMAAGSPNKLLLISTRSAYGWDAFHLADHLLTQPLHIIVGGVPGLIGSYRDGFTLLDKAASKERAITVMPGVTHVDLYWKEPCISDAVKELASFFNQHLSLGASLVETVEKLF